MKLKNKPLYDFLVYRYGKARVLRLGDTFRYRVRSNKGKKEIERVDGGEEYAVCCPMCNDDRFRLNVSHVFGTTVDDVEMWHTVHCWNENCSMSMRLKQEYLDFQQFYDGVTTTTSNSAAQETEVFTLEELAAEAQKRVVMYGGITRIDQLPPQHPACQYVASRGLDTSALGKVFAVGYCANEGREARFANKRLTIPMYYAGQLVGWQTRVIDGHTPLTPTMRSKKWPYVEPKYWTATGTRKGFFLYNYDVARRYPFCVVCEGAFDAWKIGPQAVAIWGKEISRMQAELITATWGKVVLFGDPGFDEDWERNQRTLNNIYKGDNAKLYVPPDVDAGELSYESIWERLALQLGVTPAT